MYEDLFEGLMSKLISTLVSFLQFLIHTFDHINFKKGFNPLVYWNPYFKY